MSLRKLEIREAAQGGGEVEIFELDTLGGGIVGFYQGKGKKEDILSRGHDVSTWQKAHDGFSCSHAWKTGYGVQVCTR